MYAKKQNVSNEKAENGKKQMHKVESLWVWFDYLRMTEKIKTRREERGFESLLLY